MTLLRKLSKSQGNTSDVHMTEAFPVHFDNLDSPRARSFLLSSEAVLQESSSTAQGESVRLG